MPLSQYQINEFRKRAKVAGLDDQQIEQEIAKRYNASYGGNAGMIPQQQGPAPSIAQTTSAPASQMTEQVAPPEQSGGFIANFINGLVQPAVEYGKFVGEAGHQASRFAFDPLFRKAIMEPDKITPEEASKLNPKEDAAFYSPEEAKKKLGDRAEIAMTGAKATAGAASYAIPFGKGASLASKVFIPGAVAAGLNEASREDATVGSVVEAGVTGAATAGALHAVTGMASWARGKGGELVRSSEALQEGTRKIRVKASVFGAGIEKRVNETLDKYGFSGTAQAQYEKLQPVMDEIEGKIQQVIKDNPDLAISKDTIKESFMKNLKGSLRTRDLTQKQAVDEVNGYLNDLLVAAGDVGAESGQPLLKAGAKDIPLANLREMKKVLNDDYASVYKKIEAGTSLNPREKVIAAAWDSLDDAVKSTSPEIKSLLLDESSLYRAAQPLSSARANPPTFRVMGTSVPAGITQKLRDLGSGVLKKLGLGAEKIPQGGNFQRSALEKLAAMSPVALKEQGLNDQEIEQVQQITSNLPPMSPTDMAGGMGQPGMGQDTGGGMEQMTNQPQTLNPFGGLSKRQVLSLALSQGASTKDLEEVGKIFDMLGADGETINAETMQAANGLRDEYFKRTKENNFIDISNAYQKVAGTPDNAAGDISLIFGFMKMLDPNSVVREGEFATAQNSAGVPEMVVQQYNKVLKGERLSPQQRVAFKNEAGRVFQVYQQRQAPIDAYYQGLARKYGIDPSLLGVGLYQGANQGQQNNNQ